MQEKKHVELKTSFQEKKPDNTECKTIEIVIDIMEPTAESYTEIDYEYELEEKKKKMKSIEKGNYSILEGLNFDNDNDVDVKDTAAKFEAKYGRKEENSNAKNYEPDFGGYECDSFIDNTEAFDESMPDNVVPLYGGLYICKGPVEFIKEEKDPNKPYSRVGNYRSLSIPRDQLLKDLNQKSFSLKGRQLDVENKKQAKKRKIEEGKEDKKRTKSKQPQTAFPLNSFENMFQKLNKENEGSDRAPYEISSSDSDQPNLSQTEDKLPRNFPSDVVEIVENIKKVVSGSIVMDNKIKGLVNNLLLKLEYKCKLLEKSIRFQVYDHLAPFVKCKRKSLTKRVKQLYVREEYRKANDVLVKLKIAVMVRITSLPKAREDVSSILFVWDDETKELLKDVIDLQRNCFQLNAKRNETIATRLVKFVEADLLPIWPEGWMSASRLLDYYDSVSNQDVKLSVILEQSSSASDLAPFQDVPSSTIEILSEKSAKNIDSSASEDYIIDLTIE